MDDRKIGILGSYFNDLVKTCSGASCTLFITFLELLFVSALGYCMGIAAICGYIGISPEAGAFFAGISVGNLPYRLDIEDKVGPLKLFGQILFFLTVGVEIATIQAENFSSNLGAIIPLLLLVVLIKPFFLIITGYASKNSKEGQPF